MAFHELKRAFPSYGPDWDAAIELGIDVSILLENLALTLVNETDALKAAAKRVPPDAVP